MIEANHSTTIQIEGKEYLYFGGTNYLGLAHRTELWEAASQAFQRYGFSSGASRLTSGETDLLLQLESELTEFAVSACSASGLSSKSSMTSSFSSTTSSLVLPAGFMSNRAVVEGIDELVGRWAVSKYAHGSIKSAVAGATKAGSGIAFFAEPIDPLLGTLTDISILYNQLGAHDFLILDEAHSLGVLGRNGGGALEYFGIPANDRRIIRTGTFSKAFGAQGGFIVGAQDVIDQIKSHSSSYKVSTPLSPLACAASLAALRLLKEDATNAIKALRENIEYVNKQLRISDHAVPIYHLAESPAMVELRKQLPGLGIYVPTVTSYFADFCEIGLRWTIQAGHTREQLDQLLNAIAASSAPQKR